MPPAALAATDAPDLAGPVVPDLPPTECAARLATLFPALFTPGAAKPLKLRIQADIQQRAPGIFNKKSLSVFLHRYTTSTAYLRAMVAAPHRTDLDGASAGEVADEHRQAATAELERRRTLHEERRAAEREAQRKAEDEKRKALQAQWPARPAPGAAPDGADGAASQGADVPRGPSGASDARPSVHARPRPAPGARRDGPDAARPRARPDARSDTPRRPAGESLRPEDAPRGPSDGQRRPPEQHRPRRDDSRNAPFESGAPLVAEDPGRRERAVLLRAYESTTLTRANFCALKRMTEAELDALLAQARQEAPAAPPEARTVSARQRR